MWTLTGNCPHSRRHSSPKVCHVAGWNTPTVYTVIYEKHFTSKSLITAQGLSMWTLTGNCPHPGRFVNIMYFMHRLTCEWWVYCQCDIIFILNKYIWLFLNILNVYHEPSSNILILAAITILYAAVGLMIVISSSKKSK